MTRAKSKFRTQNREEALTNENFWKGFLRKAEEEESLTLGGIRTLSFAPFVRCSTTKSTASDLTHWVYITQEVLRWIIFEWLFLSQAIFIFSSERWNNPHVHLFRYLFWDPASSRSLLCQSIAWPISSDLLATFTAACPATDWSKYKVITYYWASVVV